MEEYLTEIMLMQSENLKTMAGHMKIMTQDICELTAEVIDLRERNRELEAKLKEAKHD